MEAQLRRAAFGDNPGVSLKELAEAAHGPPRARLLAAILYGARGRYAAAATLLLELSRTRDRVLAAHAAATFAAHRRQLGGHAAALPFDALAVSLALGRNDGEPDPDGLDGRGALADGLLGLAADNLALGRITAARRLAARVDTARCRSWRSGVRAGWVGAEIELAAGNARAAIAPAQRAVELASNKGAARHLVKSRLVLAAALATAPDGDRARAAGLAADALMAAEEHELCSLIWPAEAISSGLTPSTGNLHRSRSHPVLHGVLLHADPGGRRLARESPWIPV